MLCHCTGPSDWQKVSEPRFSFQESGSSWHFNSSFMFKNIIMYIQPFLRALQRRKKKYIYFMQFITLKGNFAGTPNEWVASDRILVFAQRFLGSPRSKHCNSRKVVSKSKNNDFGERLSLFLKFFLIRNGFGYCDWPVKYNNHEIYGKIYTLTFLHAQGLLWNWHRVVSKFRTLYVTQVNQQWFPYKAKKRLVLC